MDQDIREIGLATARLVAGDDAIKDATVVSTSDWDGQPIYRFSFLVDHTRSRVERGLLRARIILALQDVLEARKDGHRPSLEMLDQRDWDRRALVA